METGYIFLVIAIAIGIFFLCRELNCWYLKINARMDLMENMLKNQKEIIRLLKKQNGEVWIDPAVNSSGEEKTYKPKKKKEGNTADCYFSIGDKVKTSVDKYGVDAGAILRVSKIIDDEMVMCTYEMKEIGKYAFYELEAL